MTSLFFALTSSIFKIYTYKWNYTIFVFLYQIYFCYNNVLTFIHVIANGKISLLIMAKKYSIIYIFIYVCVYTSYCFYLFISPWIFRLFLCLNYCELSCSECGGADISLRWFFCLLWIYTQKWNCSFSSSHVWIWELDHKRSWAPKNWCFWTVVLEKTLECPLDCKEIQPVHPKGNQSWIFIGRTDAEDETAILRPTDVKNWLIGKDPDAEEEKGITEDGTVGWRHRLNGQEFE